MEALIFRGASLLKCAISRKTPPLVQRFLPSLNISTNCLARTTGVYHFPSIRQLSTETQFDRRLTKEEERVTQQAVSLVNNIIETKTEGRLFAVVQVCGKQFKVTNNDIIVVEGYWPPDLGDEIRLEKVLLVGSADFSLVGRPLLSLNQVSVKATVIEKGMTHTRVRFKYVKRKQYKRIQFQKEQQTFLRINTIEMLNKVDDLGDVDGTIDRVF